MEKKVLKIFLMFFIFSLYIHTYPANRPWVQVKIKNYFDLLNANVSYNPKGEHPDIIRDKLELRYEEAWNVWESKKSNLPACINCVLENFDVQKIKLDWEYRLLHEKIEDKYVVSGSGQKCPWLIDGKLDPGGWPIPSNTIVIENVFAGKYSVSDYFLKKGGFNKCGEKITTNDEFSTAAVIFHELLHLALKYNESTKKCKHDGEIVNSWGYEPKVEDCTSLVFSNAIRLYESKCENPEGNDCDCQNKEGTDKPGLGSPGRDAADDNFSFASGVSNQFSIKFNPLIFSNGYSELMNNLLSGLYFTSPESPEKLLKASPIIVIPSGGLFGKENDTTLRIVLQEYVRLGGTILVFGQQYGAHFEKLMPVPEGETLKAFGWREDQSCINGSSYFSSSHPVLSSSPGGLVQIAVDGHFPQIPTGSTVILKKRTNNEPVLLHYKYGQGSVILTSLYSDWGYAHSQASEFELKIVRDLITFARNPDLSIPTFDMDVIPNPFIGLNVDVKNDSEYPAAKVRLAAYTPDRNITLHEVEQNISLNPGEETMLV